MQTQVKTTKKEFVKFEKGDLLENTQTNRRGRLVAFEKRQAGLFLKLCGDEGFLSDSHVSNWKLIKKSTPIPPFLTEEQVKDKLIEMYKEEKNTKFIMHLIHAYHFGSHVPLKRIDNFGSGDDLGKAYCSLTNVRLYSEAQLSDKKEKKAQAFQGMDTETTLCAPAVIGIGLFVKYMLSVNDKRISFIVSKKEEDKKIREEMLAMDYKKKKK